MLRFRIQTLFLCLSAVLYSSFFVDRVDGQVDTKFNVIEASIGQIHAGVF